MSYHGTVMGESGEAFTLSQKYQLQTIRLFPETFDWLADRMIRYFDAPPVTVEKSKRMGNGKKGKTFGRWSHNAAKTDFRIRLANDSVEMATFLHEISHHLDFAERGRSDHRQPFKRKHEDVLRAFVSNRIVNRADLAKENLLVFGWTRFAKAYDRFKLITANDDEMVIKLLSSFGKNVPHGQLIPPVYSENF